MTAPGASPFLAGRGHGVLAFNTDEPYAVPVSYGYDVASGRCYLQLVFGESSKKREHIEQSDRVCLVVYEWNALTDWQSVVLTGRLRELALEEEPESARAFVRGAAIPDMSVFKDSLNDLEVTWYELEYDSLEERHPSGELF